MLANLSTISVDNLDLGRKAWHFIFNIKSITEDQY